MTGILVNEFVILILIFLRVISAFTSAPIFGHSSIPITVKIFFSLIISYIISLTFFEKNIVIDLNLWSLAILAVKEILTGLTLGFMLNFVFWGISYAGSLMGFEMGLAIAQAFNPVDETDSNVLGQFLYFAAFLIFFLINGHHYIIQALAYSFSIVPFGSNPITGPVIDLLIVYSASVFVLAVKIAAPILVSFFLVTVAEGILARAIPQMQVFFVTQPLKLGLGFLLMSTILPIYIYVIKNLLESYENSLISLLKGMVP